MIPRIVLPLALGALGLSLIAAMAAEGRLDYLPPQPYFPDSFKSALVECDVEGDRWTDRLSDGVSPREPLLNEFRADWYSLFWRASHERSLYEASRSAETSRQRSVRFTWLRAFHTPVIVRLDEMAPHQYRLTAKELGTGKGGYSAGRVTRRLTRLLTPEEVGRVERALSEDRILDLPPRGCGYGADGAIWIVDANDRGRYRFVERWSPEGGPVRAFGYLLLALTGWQLEPRY